MTATSSSPPAPAGPAASACTKPSIAWPCATAGFDGFRVLLFQQSGGLSQSDAEAGLEMNLDFFLGILNALNCGDVMNEVAYAVRPYEVNAGETDRMLDESHGLYARGLPQEAAVEARRSLTQVPGRLLRYRRVHRQVRQPAQGRRVHPAPCTAAATAFNEVEIDRLRVKPIVKITGEFWAQTTEGDGNFNMFNFLQKEGAQVLVEPIGTWIMYMIHQVVQKYKDFKGLEEGAVLPPIWKTRQARQDRMRASARKSPS